MAGKDDDQKPIIIKKKKKGGHEEEHAGTWKIAYADFVTAMMAFFLMLWLLNATTEEQRDGIADYFSPTAVSKSTSGGGGMLSGQTVAKDGALVHRRAPIGVNIKLPPAGQIGSPENEQTDDTGDDTNQTKAELKAKLREKEREAFDRIEQQLQKAVKKPGLTDLKENLRVQQTDEGMKIQIVDQADQPMFASGSAEPLPRTRKLLGRVAEAIKDLPNDAEITGHTSSVPFRNREDYSNWELSADRANASRRVLVENGLQPNRVTEVAGRADENLLLPNNPTSPRNRRISILMRYADPEQTRSDDVVVRRGPDGTITAIERADSADNGAPERGGPSILDETDTAQ